MAIITKSELLYKDYSWTHIPGDDPRVSGKPDSTRLSRKEGYEMIYFVNKFCELHDITTKKEANKVEQLIREQVPTSIQSQEKIREWLKEKSFMIYL